MDASSLETIAPASQPEPTHSIHRPQGARGDQGVGGPAAAGQIPDTKLIAVMSGPGPRPPREPSLVFPLEEVFVSRASDSRTHPESETGAPSKPLLVPRLVESIALVPTRYPGLRSSRGPASPTWAERVPGCCCRPDSSFRSRAPPPLRERTRPDSHARNSTKPRG